MHNPHANAAQGLSLHTPVAACGLEVRGGYGLRLCRCMGLVIHRSAACRSVGGDMMMI